MFYTFGGVYEKPSEYKEVEWRGREKDEEKWLVKYAANNPPFYLENSHLGASLLASEMLYYIDMKGFKMQRNQ